MNTSYVSGSCVSRIVTTTIVAILLLVAVLYRDGLVRWFTGGQASTPAASHRGASQAGATTSEYANSIVDALRTAMAAYDRIRAGLAHDDTTGVSEAARTMSEALTSAGSSVRDGSKTSFVEAAAAADKVSKSPGLDATRHAFADFNALLIPLVGSDARLTRSKHVFECSMFEHAKWFQTDARIENPYMGIRMPGCGNESDWRSDKSVNASASDGEVDHYTCSMHPSVNQIAPGKCPICGMELIAVTAQQQREGVVVIDEARRQLIGVRTAPVVEAPMSRALRALGKVAYDESAYTDVNLKVSGWITKLLINQTGQRVARGQPLFTIYSPDLYAAQQDLLLALRASRAGTSTTSDGSPGRSEHLVRAARKRLSLLGLSDALVDEIAARAEPLDTIPIISPAAGFVIEKDVVEGASVQAGMRLFRIAGLDKVWVEADVYEDDLGLVHAGQAAKVTLDYLPSRAYDAKVSYVYPYLETGARTGRVRIELTNHGLELRPGMYARVDLSSQLGTRLQVPASAVVYTGPRRLVFVDLGGGRFKPQEVHTGIEASGMYEVLDGLTVGDSVATSGTFLIAAEARISTAAKYWGADEPMPAMGPHTESGAPDRQAVEAVVPPKRRPTANQKPQQKNPVSTGVAPHTGAPEPAATRGNSSTGVFSCPMHPDVRSDVPGKCPKCGMDLVPAAGRTQP